MLNKLLDIIEKTDVDVVMCEFDQLLIDNITVRSILKFNENIGEGILVKENIIDFLNSNTNGNYGFLYAKLYKKSVFIDNNICFTINFGEDIIVNYTLLKKINSIYLLKKALYLNRANIDSICAQIINPKIVNDKKEALIVFSKIDANKLNLVDENFIVRFLLEYQNPMFISKIQNEEFEKNQRFILFGSANLGKQYMMTLERYEYYNIIFVDNDKSKQNTYIRKHKIISIDELKTIKKDTDVLIISSQYFVYILKQLLDNKIISSVSEVLISKDNTKIKNALIDFFETSLSILN